MGCCDERLDSDGNEKGAKKSQKDSDGQVLENGVTPRVSSSAANRDSIAQDVERRRSSRRRSSQREPSQREPSQREESQQKMGCCDERLDSDGNEKGAKKSQKDSDGQVLENGVDPRVSSSAANRDSIAQDVERRRSSRRRSSQRERSQHEPSQREHSQREEAKHKTGCCDERLDSGGNEKGAKKSQKDSDGQALVSSSAANRDSIAPDVERRPASQRESRVYPRARSERVASQRISLNEPVSASVTQSEQEMKEGDEKELPAEEGQDVIDEHVEMVAGGGHPLDHSDEKIDDTDENNPPEVTPYEMLSKAVVDSHNKLRKTPQLFISMLESDLTNFKGKVLRRPNRMPQHTFEGREGWREALEALKKMESGALPEIKWSDELARAAIKHTADIGPAGSMSHTGTDGSTMQERVASFCTPKAALAENLDFGNSRADEIVLALFIDDGIRSRGHRANLISPNFKVMGVACGPHQKHRCMTTMVYAGRAVALNPPIETPLIFSTEYMPEDIEEHINEENIESTISDYEPSMPDWALDVKKKTAVELKVIGGKDVTKKTTTLTYITKTGTEVKKHIVNVKRIDADGKVSTWSSETVCGDPTYKFHT